MNRVGTGSVCQAGLQSVWGTPVAPDTLLNMTGESIKTTVEKGDEGNLMASKTRNQADVMSIKVDGSVSVILRPEFVDWLLEAAMGAKSDNVYTLAAPNTELPVSTFLLSRGGIVKTYPDVTIKSIKIAAAAQDYVKVDMYSPMIDDNKDRPCFYVFKRTDPLLFQHFIMTFDKMWKNDYYSHFIERDDDPHQ